MPSQGPTLPELFLTSALVAVALVGVIILFVLVYQRRLMRQQRQMAEMAQQHQRQLLAASIQSQEEERHRIARDLHDEVGGLLAAAKMRNGALGRKLNQQEDLASLATGVQEILSTSLQTVRSISHSLLSPTLQRLGLLSALEELFQRVEGPEVVFQVAGSPRPLSADQSIGVYRIVQELISNTIRHAEATRMGLKVAFAPEQIAFTYHDNGRGFDAPEAASRSTRGIGLDNIESRAQVIGAKLSLQTAPGEGMSLTITLMHKPQAGP